MQKYRIKAIVTLLKKSMVTYSETRTIELEAESLPIATARYYMKLLEEKPSNDRVGLVNVDFIKVEKI